jgi:hypothetical protein
MLSISSLCLNAEKYYLNLYANYFPCDDVAIPGRWDGQGSIGLGLSDSSQADLSQEIGDEPSHDSDSTSPDHRPPQ